MNANGFYNDENTDEYIVCSDQTKLYFVNKDSSMYKNKVILLYGEANSGKSTILKDILYILRDEISIPYAFVPTDYINNSYRSILPENSIYKEVDVELLKDIWEGQKRRAKLYEIANNMNVLHSLFNKIATGQDKRISKMVILKAKKSIYDVKHSSSDLGTRKSEQYRIEKERDKNLSLLFKGCIKKSLNALQKMELDHEQKISIKYMDMNPNIVIIFDDCLSTAAKWKNEEIFKQLFMEGRHSYITQLYTLQDDKGIGPELRKNARLAIFTSSNVASTHFDAKSNGYHISEKKKAQKIIERIFSHKRGGPINYQKMVYNKDDPDKFGIIIADLHDNFMVGSSYVWRFFDRIPRKGKDRNMLRRDTNEYLHIRD